MTNNYKMKPTNKTYRKFQQLILKSEGKTFVEILGQDITLMRILKYLGVNYCCNGKGQIIHEGQQREVCIYDLDKPLHEQNEAVINSLLKEK